MLPGVKLTTVSVFDLKPGMKVYDKASNLTGVITDVKETTFECVEAFITLEGQKEIAAKKLPSAVLL